MPSPSVALLRTQSDDRLVALAAAGHERAFEAIVERYRRPLLRHCRRYLPEARAEDALQLALVSAWTALRRGDDVRSLRPWLYRIVHNTALNALRAPGYDYEQLRETLEGSGGPAELAERRAVVHGTLAGLAALPERQRDALLQIAVEGRSQDEVAHDLGLSQGAVRQLVHRARSNLRAAATALTPLPLASWLATAGGERGDVALRLGELVTGAGAGATLAKAGTVAVLAGSAVGGPAVVRHLDDGTPRAARASALAKRAPARKTDAAPARSAAAAGVAVPATRTPAVAGTGNAAHDDDATAAKRRAARRERARGGDRSRHGGSEGHDDDRTRQGGSEGRDDDRGGDDHGGAGDRSGPARPVRAPRPERDEAERGSGEDRADAPDAEDEREDASHAARERVDPPREADEPEVRLDSSGPGPRDAARSGDEHAAATPEPAESPESGEKQELEDGP